MSMLEITIHYRPRTHSYCWKLSSRNGELLAISKNYRTKFHCIARAKKLFPKAILTDLVRDRRYRA